MTVTTHLRNQILTAIDHATAAHRGPLAVANTIADAVVATIDAHATCTYCRPTAPDLRADPARRELHGLTGIYVRAVDETEKWINADLAELDQESLNAFLRSRGGENEWAEATVRILLGWR